MRSTGGRHKHIRLNQEKLDRVKSALGSATETEAIERAMDFVLAEQEILKAHRRVRSRGRVKRLFS
jgi:hypothetical protein